MHPWIAEQANREHIAELRSLGRPLRAAARRTGNRAPLGRSGGIEASGTDRWSTVNGGSASGSDHPGRHHGPWEAMMEAVPATPFIGRSAELEHLGSLLGLGPSERPSAAVLVGGDAGVGKSRLITELIRRVTGSDYQASIGHCVDLGDSPRALPSVHRRSWAGSAPSRRLEAEAMVLRRPALRRLMPATGSGAEESRPGHGDRPVQPVRSRGGDL